MSQVVVVAIATQYEQEHDLYNLSMAEGGVWAAKFLYSRPTCFHNNLQSDNIWVCQERFEEK